MAERDWDLVKGVVIGGLITSTLLTLVLLPMLYERFGESLAEREAQGDDEGYPA